MVYPKTRLSNLKKNRRRKNKNKLMTNSLASNRCRISKTINHPTRLFLEEELLTGRGKINKLSKDLTSK
jgi:hypothetical protein